MLPCLLPLELQRGGIDAVALAGRVRAVREDMAEVATAVGAQDLRSNHPMARVGLLLDRVLRRGGRERGPAAAGVVLRVRLEKLYAAPGAAVGPGLENVVVLVDERRFGALLPQHVVLLGRQLSPPLGVGLLHLGHVHSVSSERWVGGNVRPEDRRQARPRGISLM